jgi:hypothetical protein
MEKKKSLANLTPAQLLIVLKKAELEVKKGKVKTEEELFEILGKFTLE